MRIVILTLMLPLLAFAQPDTLWTRNFDSGGDDYASEILNTADGGFVLASSAIAASVDFRLTRTDVNGDTMWSRAYGTDQGDWCATMVPVAAGGWLMCGFTFPPASLYPDAYLVRVNDGGDTLWTRIVGGAQTSEAAHAILPLADGGFLIAGDMDVTQQGLADVYLIRINAGGDTLWTRTYEQPTIEGASGICALSDGNILIAGSYHATQNDPIDFYLMKITLSSDTLWTRSYGAAGNDLLYKVLPTADGGAVFTGLTDSFDPGGDLYLGKINSAGDSLWVHLYGGAGEDHGHSVAAMSDGGFLICGHSTSFDDPSGDAYLVRTDSEGNLQWSYLYGSPGYDSGEAVRQTADGGIILAGNRLGGPTSDVFLVRLDHEQRTMSPPHVPAEFTLHPNYPNPFNAVTSIAFDLTAALPVMLSIYNLSGQRVATLIDQPLVPGAHTVAFDASRFASGIYVYRLKAGDVVRQKKMVLIR